MKTSDLQRRLADAAQGAVVNPPPTNDIVAIGRRRRASAWAVVLASVFVAVSAGVGVASYLTGEPGEKELTADNSSKDQIGAADLQSRVDDCAKRGVAGALDVPGPGQATPESAVDRVDATGGTAIRVSDTEEFAQVAVVDDADQLLRIYTVYERGDGWWPNAFTDCLHPSQP